mmetsp:Transcript_80631/g.231506  ORF Transcript_80631/g.231506 Transcript_80631/m.231506 type:complete len:220 (+) Transcript_80631:1297-1956(+)
MASTAWPRQLCNHLHEAQAAEVARGALLNQPRAILILHASIQTQRLPKSLHRICRAAGLFLDRSGGHDSWGYDHRIGPVCRRGLDTSSGQEDKTCDGRIQGRGWLPSAAQQLRSPRDDSLAATTALPAAGPGLLGALATPCAFRGCGPAGFAASIPCGCIVIVGNSDPLTFPDDNIRASTPNELRGAAACTSATAGCGHRCRRLAGECNGAPCGNAPRG